MESGCLTFTTASAPSRPAIFLPRNTSNFKQFQANRLFSPSSSFAESSSSSGKRRGRGRGLCIKASEKAIFSANQSLASNWDVSNFTGGPSGLPRFEELDTTNMLLRQRIVYLGYQIDELSADFIISQLLFLDAENPEKDIKLFIHTPGGSTTAGMGIYDAMKLCNADISTICIGIAASMGAFLLAAGSKGKRFCMPNARVMMHQPIGGYGGTVSEVSIRKRELTYQMVKMNKILSRITGKTEEQIELDTSFNYYLNPWEAKEYGLVDEVIDDGKPGLVAPIADASPPPKPPVFHLWEVEGCMMRSKESLPSEENPLPKGNRGPQGNDEEQESGQKEETPVPS